MSHWRRTRMISFRVSEDEFARLKTKSEAEGARSVSEFARITLCGQTNTASGGSNEHHASADAVQFTNLRADLQELNASVRRVADLIERGPIPVPTRVPMLALGRKSGGV